MLRISQIAFAIALIGLGLIGLLHKDFSIIIPPEAATQPKWLYMLGDGLVILGGLFVIFQRYELGSLLCALAILVFSYILKILPILAHSSFLQILNSAESWETLGLFGGCLILASTIKKNKALFFIGLALQSTWFTWAGIGHFMYKKYVMSLFPAYIPYPMFWLYFCAICLVLAGIGLWVPKYSKLTATLAAIMLFLWCIMLHIPNYVHRPYDISYAMGIFESLGFAGIMGMVASARSIKN